MAQFGCGMETQVKT